MKLNKFPGVMGNAFVKSVGSRGFAICKPLALATAQTIMVIPLITKNKIEKTKAKYCKSSTARGFSVQR